MSLAIIHGRGREGEEEEEVDASLFVPDLLNSRVTNNNK